MTAPADKIPMLRLDRLLANLGYGTRTQMQAMAHAGRIKLDGAALRDPALRVAATPEFCARLSINGEALDPPPGMVIALNKPRGVTCSRKEAGPLVFDLLPPRFRLREPALSTVGRLDKDTSGLLLITDDGALLHRLISPKHNIAKRYCAKLARPLRGDEAEIFASGEMMLDDEAKPLLPAVLRVLSPTEAEVSVTEGRYHQIRRMFAATGNHVLELHRMSIGDFALPLTLAPGDFLLLRASEAEAAVRGEALRAG
ncbi:pseudouridine synthase [Methylocella silvestris BL2]|uniref:Pseudouridine synthase n=1 Tax=Methylocella silvestris (strain DSM 15510 / CIP 108128 / LMG 27833 / NCIMB 13906 / BL2) TaxID=395965 RepID=B8ET33_METSB|nr:16S rRNA pseudouridine(516) synthase [Methylocella silvestris]ACK51171.1 pseudouridine synthase [Methylocella silvestris BL2]